MEVLQENEVEQNTSMEKLIMEEDENVKESSLEEDILGVQSLLMSETDDDSREEEISTNKHPTKKKGPDRKKRILDSDNEEKSQRDNIQQEADIIDENKTDHYIYNKKISALIDSESEQETEDPNEMEKTHQLISYESEDEKMLKQSYKQLKAEIKTKNKLNKNRKNKANKNGKDKFRKSNKRTESPFVQSSSDSESKDKKYKAKKMSVLVDSESDSEFPMKNGDLQLESLVEATNSEDNMEECLKGKNSKSKVIRASAKKAMNEMQVIQSEQQRLHREAHISIPYHKPKQHSLDEFLKRRTIIRPRLSAEMASPVAETLQARSLKMSAEELEEYAKLMEERAKEATEFFKSASESEEETVPKDNDILDKPAEEKPIENSSEESLYTANENETKEYSLRESKAEKEEENIIREQLSEIETAEVLIEEKQTEEKEEERKEIPACSKVLITEVIELPKLNMNTVKISPVKKRANSSLLNIKELLSEKDLSLSPSLSGGPNKLIDLETGDLIEKKPTGIENLLKRLMSTVKAKKSKTSETCNIVSIENGKLELSKVNISLSETHDVHKEPKPGAAYFELKKNLKEIIKKKRLAEVNKKQEDELEYTKCLEDDDDDDSDKKEGENEEKEYEENNATNSKNKVILVDDEENALLVDEGENVEMNSEEDNTINKIGIDDEDDEDENDYDKDENDDDENYEVDCDKNNMECTEQSQRKNRIIKVLDDTDEDDNDDINFLKTQLPSAQHQGNELMALCSGTSGISQKAPLNALMSQIPLTQNNGKPLNDEELMELCSGTFDESVEAYQQSQSDKIMENIDTTSNKILSSVEEEEESEEQKGVKRRVKRFTKKRNKKKTKLGFSDDDDEDYNKEEVLDGDEMNNIGPKTNIEEPETFIDYDSEENEILVKMSKEDKITQAQNFLEKEAELSESEWGSADEDEKNLDKYDIELGDEDEFDSEKLRAELEQIHARKMLDEDIRNVRKIQEMLFEDEEKDGIGRQRTFKWKNAESGFSLDDVPLDEVCKGQDSEGDDEIDEHQWRKIRYEREQFLKEHSLKPDFQNMSVLLSSTSMPTLHKICPTKMLQIITSKKISVSASDSKKSSPFLISKGITAMHKKSIRGSFLVRNKETLNKLAGLTKGTSSVISSEADDTAGSVSIKSIKPQNFVFATLTEEEHENLKRKSDDLMNSSNENGKNFMKKPKIEPRREKCFIDQLL